MVIIRKGNIYDSGGGGGTGPAPTPQGPQPIQPSPSQTIPQTQAVPEEYVINAPNVLSGETERFKIYWEKQREKMRKEIKTELRDSEPIGKRIGEKNMDAVMSARNVPALIKMARGMASDVPDNVWQAQFLDIKEDKTPLISGKRQKLKSSLILLNQTILKMFQGAKPTDRDFEILKSAIDASSKGREPFLAAMDVVEDIFNRKRDDLVTIIEFGYEVDRNKLNKMIGLGEGASNTDDPMGVL